MITSMTAFGRVEQSWGWGAAAWEIRSVNHRYLEMTIRLPEDLRQLEATVRERVAARLSRGKIDCTLRLDVQPGASDSVSVNQALVKRLLAAAAELPIPQAREIDPMDVLRWPGVLSIDLPDAAALSDPLMNLLEDGLAAVVETRQREGAKIAAMLEERCGVIEQLVSNVRARAPEIAATLRDRYRQKAGELRVELDRDRLEQEVLILAQKADVSEELDRLETHAAEVRRVLDEDKPVGRRLDFLMQELNREANTLGSKAASVDIGNASVDLKVLIEQMREQIQNVE